MLLKKPHEKRSQENIQRNFLTEQLQFSEVQKEQFSILEQMHSTEMNAFDDQIMKNKNQH